MIGNTEPSTTIGTAVAEPTTEVASTKAALVMSVACLTKGLPSAMTEMLIDGPVMMMADVASLLSTAVTCNTTAVTHPGYTVPLWLYFTLPAPAANTSLKLILSWRTSWCLHLPRKAKSGYSDILQYPGHLAMQLGEGAPLGCSVQPAPSPPPLQYLLTFFLGVGKHVRAYS